MDGLNSELVQALTQIEVLRAKHDTALRIAEGIIDSVANEAGCERDMLSILRWIRNAREALEAKGERMNKRETTIEGTGDPTAGERAEDDYPHEANVVVRAEDDGEEVEYYLCATVEGTGEPTAGEREI
jgi:hypothetical protein